MDDDQTGEQESLFPKSTGDKLREAREGMGLTLADIAARTRVPMRHLEAIELGDYSGLPSSTYAIGFAKAYARAVGVDEKTIAAEVRNNPHLPIAQTTDYEAYQPSDAKRLPSRGVALVAGAIAVLLLIGVVIWYGTSLFRGSEEPSLVIPPDNTVAAAPEPAPAPVGGGQVTLTATAAVWVKIYDAAGKTLLEKTMAAGERYDVPSDANNPMIVTGRPDQIQVTVNGSAVAPLGTGKLAIKDVPISAAALQARGTGTPAVTTPVPAPAATPAAASSPASSSAVPPAFRPTPAPTGRPTPQPTPKAAPTPENFLPPVTAPTPTP